MKIQVIRSFYGKSFSEIAYNTLKTEASESYFIIDKSSPQVLNSNTGNSEESFNLTQAFLWIIQHTL